MTANFAEPMTQGTNNRGSNDVHFTTYPSLRGDCRSFGDGAFRLRGVDGVRLIVERIVSHRH